MQTGNELTDDIAPNYTGGSFVFEEPSRFSFARRSAAVVAAWLVPGAGHLALGRYGRAALFFVAITGAFVLGLSLNGRLFWPTVAEPPSIFHFDLITLLWFFAQIGSGLCYLVSYAIGFGTRPTPEAATFEYGNTFMFLAGLLNYLVIHDAFDIAAGRKR
ncbi:MAG: DUF6677 family protein [Blastocatellia bacterium]